MNFWARVDTVQKDTISVTHGQTLYIQTNDLTVRSGDLIHVYGTLKSEQQLEVERIIVSPQFNRLYMIVASAGGVVLSLFVFIRHWKVDARDWAIVPRNQ